MSEPNSNTGPSPETLANLKAMMPSFIKGLKKKSIIGKGLPAKIRRPRKACKVCGLLFDHAWIAPQADIEIKPDLCKTCKPLLESGYFALVCGEDYLIGKSPGLSSWSGEIKQVSPHVMEAAKKEFSAAKPRINGGHRETQ